jgi:hypothetical protein
MLSMLFTLLSDAVKRALRRVRAAPATDTQQSSPQEAIPGLPDHLVVAYVLRSENFDDPADLTRLPAVSRAMRDAVTATGNRLEHKFSAARIASLGSVSAMERLQRGGRLPNQKYLSWAAARSGNFEKLQEYRASGFPWDTHTCAMAAEGGHLEVLQWARANGCPWDNGSCYFAAWKGHVEILRWARARGCRWTRLTRAKAAILGYFESDGSSSEESDDEGEGNLSSQLLQN